MRLATPTAAVLLATTLLAAAQTTPAPKLPFIISKETTDITEPLLSDGTPDYIGAFNAKLSKGVTPDTNAFTLYAQLVDPQTDLVLESDTALVRAAVARILKLAGVTPAPPDSPHFQNFFDWFAAKNSDNAAQRVAGEEFNLTRVQLWIAADHPQVHDYLESQSRALDAMVQVSKRPRWWFPAVVQDDHFMEGFVLFNGTILRQAGNSLAARALFRARAGDFDGFLSDALAVKRLGHLVAGDGILVNAMSGALMDRIADEALGAVVGSGTLTQPQCKAISAALAAFDPITDTTVGYQIECWEHLRFIQLLATHQQEDLKNVPVNQEGVNTAEYFSAIDTASVDWNVVLKGVNENFAQVLAAMKLPTLKAVKAASDSLDESHNQYSTQNGIMPDLHKKPDETAGAYSQRLRDFFINGLSQPSVYINMMDYPRRAHFEDQMLATLLAAATQKSQTGNWPKTLDALVPTTLKQVPLDLYPIDNPAPIKMLLSPNGLRIYSIGPNGIDDRGGNDDIAIGPPPPAENLP